MPEDTQPNLAQPAEVSRDANLAATIGTPLPLAPGGFQTRAAHLQHFASLTRDLGRDPISIVERYGIDRQALSSPEDLVDCAALIRMVRECGESLHNPLFGVQLAQRQSTHVIGILEPFCRAAPDFGTAMQMLVEFLPVAHSPRCTLDMVEGSTTAELRMDEQPSDESHQQLVYGALATLLMLMRDLGGAAFSPLSVSIGYDRRGQDVRCTRGGARLPCVRWAGPQCDLFW